MKHYQQIPKTAPSHRCKLDHEWQAIQKKLEKHMNLMVQWKEEDNEDHFWAAMGMVRSVWEDINQKRKRLQTPEEKHFLLNKREDDDSVKLLSEKEYRNIKSSRLQMRMEEPQAGKLQTYSEWKAQNSAQFTAKNSKVQKMMGNRNQDKTDEHLKMQKISPYCSPSSREPTPELGQFPSGFQSAASASQQSCSCNATKQPGSPQMPILGAQAKIPTMGKTGNRQTALTSN